jgi:hypothetical protein
MLHNAREHDLHMKTHPLAQALLPSSTFTRDIGRTLDIVREQTLEAVPPLEGVHEMITALMHEAETHIMETKHEHYNSLLEMTNDLLTTHFTEEELDALYALHKAHPEVLGLYAKFGIEWAKNTALKLRTSIREMVDKKREEFDADHKDSQ